MLGVILGCRTPITTMNLVNQGFNTYLVSGWIRNTGLVCWPDWVHRLVSHARSSCRDNPVWALHEMCALDQVQHMCQLQPCAPHAAPTSSGPDLSPLCGTWHVSLVWSMRYMQDTVAVWGPWYLWHLCQPRPACWIWYAGLIYRPNLGQPWIQHASAAWVPHTAYAPKPVPCTACRAVISKLFK